MRKVGFIKRACFLLAALLAWAHSLFAMHEYELNTGWRCARAENIKATGVELSMNDYPLDAFMEAVVPGTVLTSLLHNRLIPDPFYGMNNKQIPDIYHTGNAYYTYWFVKDFTEAASAPGEKVWLTLRGVNNSCDVFLNGHKVNARQYRSMYLTQGMDITSFLSATGQNRLAVIVYPPLPVGNPNGGQGGDGVIAHNITNQFAAGWDWIQPIRDRNTGIWDKVIVRRTGRAILENLHVTTSVPGARLPQGKQEPAMVHITADVVNTSDELVNSKLVCKLGGRSVTVDVMAQPHERIPVKFPAMAIQDPQLWWPNGVGPQYLYPLKVQVFAGGDNPSDEANLNVGVRAIEYVWNKHTKSREIRVNGQPVFIKGGNWILSDAQLRLSKERYDAEVRYHRDMGLNMIRVWGGGITERPEFYDACDKYGLLVFQDFWVSGDCNGRWYDPLKLEDTNARRKYPEDHKLFLASCIDQIKLLRNHASLAIWCGGNEIHPPLDILKPLRDSLLPLLDGTRFFFEFSNDDSMSYKSGDGPYTIQKDNYFWEHRSFPFNSEIGSIGLGDYESIVRIIPPQNRVAPFYDTIVHKWVVDSVWQYHKYSSYDSAVEVFGHPADAEDFARKAQLVNYNQYRALMEGFTSRMWDWYTGVLIWKTQNPWSAMLGQMYDVYLDPNACLYGVKTGAAALHVMYNPTNRRIMVANNHTTDTPATGVRIRMVNRSGLYEEVEKITGLTANSCDNYARLPKKLPVNTEKEGVFLQLSLLGRGDTVLDENVYALPSASGDYSWLSKMDQANISIFAVRKGADSVEVTIENVSHTTPWGKNTVAFFNRLALVDADSKERLLPMFSSDNYITLLPNERKKIILMSNPVKSKKMEVSIEGWNVKKQYIIIK